MRSKQVSVVREIHTLRSTWRGLETWHGRNAVTPRNRKGEATGNTNFDPNRRARPRPYRAEATKHERPGCRSPSCPAAVFAAVGTIRGASKLGGRNITKYLHPRKQDLREVVIRGTDAGSRPIRPWGRPMTPWKKQATAH